MQFLYNLVSLLDMKNNIKSFTSIDSKSIVDFINERLKLVMPEVNKQVKVYEEKLKAGKLTTPPKYSPLFCE
jgi:hypothetical protein